MDLTNGAITFEHIYSPTEIARLKKAGFKEVSNNAEPVNNVIKHVPDDILAEMCSKVGLKPSDLEFDSDNPTLVEVKRAIKTAVKAVS